MATNPFDEGSVVEVPAAIASKVNGPAIALIITGVLNVLAAIYYSVSFLMFSLSDPQKLQQDPGFQQMQERMQQEMQGEAMPMDPTKMIEYAQSFGLAFIVGALLMLVLGVVIILGGVRMKQLRSYGLAMTAAILAMIPCTSPCCVLGLPIGIWALVVLNNSEVKSAFR